MEIIKQNQTKCFKSQKQHRDWCREYEVMSIMYLAQPRCRENCTHSDKCKELWKYKDGVK